MKPVNWPAVERVVRTPEGREQVERMLEITREGVTKSNEALAHSKRALADSEENVRFYTRDVEASTAQANHWQAQADRLEQILRESADGRAM